VVFAASISYRGVTRLRFIPTGIEINSEIYINTILKPMFEKDIPDMYGEYPDKVIFHHDNAPAYQLDVTEN
jgi:hypothetical protein